MKAVLDPSILFISLDEWQSQNRRDEFLYHLLENLSIINEYKITRIYWTDMLEVLLWNDPHLPPWRKDRDWSLQLVPIIYKLLMALVDNITIEGLDICSSDPELICHHGKIEAVNETLRMIRKLIICNKSFYLCMGIVWNGLNIKMITFFCDDLNKKSNPKLIINPNEWLVCIDIENIEWPSRLLKNTT